MSKLKSKPKTQPRASEKADSAAAIILFGVDDRGPRAARFRTAHAELAGKAAQLMGLNVCQVTTPELNEIAMRLPAGRIYANGRGFVPNVRAELHDRVVKAATASGQSEPASTQPVGPSAEPGTSTESSGVAQGLPNSWNEIDVGHMVIAQETLEWGWWEAIVIERQGDMLTLRWRDYVKQPKFKRHRNAVALLNPNPS